ncbi:MAG: redox-regulated ATPase YchF [Planctomycetes bacterium]|nr:redox-regulated ATPase YchF [Planctomycetota bacterium]
MKIGIVGYQGSGKSTLFHWLTGEPPDPSMAHRTRSAMATVPEPRVEALRKIYLPKKVSLAALEIVDTPGLHRSHEGSAAKLALIRDTGCLFIVVAAYDGSDPAADLSNFEDDLLITDLDIVSGRIERLRESIKKPRPNRDELQAELDMLLPLHRRLEEGRAAHHLELTPELMKTTKSFQLFCEKPRMALINTAEGEGDAERYAGLLPPTTPLFAFSLGLESELATLSAAEREEFCREMELQGFDRDLVIRTMMETSGQMLYFTAGDREVRTWMLPKGGTALDAAGTIHTDLAQGFIRAETMNIDDLIRLGSEREMKAHNLVRHEPKDYVVQEGDVLLIRHN